MQPDKWNCQLELSQEKLPEAEALGTGMSSGIRQDTSGADTARSFLVWVCRRFGNRARWGGVISLWGRAGSPARLGELRVSGLEKGRVQGDLRVPSRA